MKKTVLLIFAFFILSPLSAESVKIKAQKHKLDNGLTILLVPNHQAPTISCRLFFTTGSVHEYPGRSGIAHMLEHMLFKGTRKVGIKDSVLDVVFMKKEDSLRAKMDYYQINKDSLNFRKTRDAWQKNLEEHRKIFIKDELWDAYLKAGGTGLNAFTSDLMTAYFVTLPKNKLELYLWLESDRMVNGVLREFYPERDVVREERRMRYDDSPTGRYFEALGAIFYEAHPYRIPTIGWPSDIENLTKEKAEEHYRKYYKPNNAILVLAGDFAPDSVLPLIRKYFSNIPRGEDFARITIEEPPQNFEKRLTQYKDDAKPRYDLMFHAPGIGHEDLFALSVLEGVLSGQSGRLYKRLVQEENVATAAGAENSVDKYYSTFYISVSLKPEAEPAKVENMVWDEIYKLQDTLISERELQKVKNQNFAQYARSMENLEHLATQLAFYEMYGDWNLINTYQDGVLKVTPAQVQQAARKYFARSLSTVGMILPLSLSPDRRTP